MNDEIRFGADELGPVDEVELRRALDAVVALEMAAAELPVSANTPFTNRVMAALTHEPSPAPGGFLLPIRVQGLVHGFTESVRQAWASIGSGRPTFARAAALAYVLVVAIAGTSLVGAATFGAAGALGLLEPRQSIEPTPSTAPPVAPTPTLVPTPSTEPEPSESPEAAEPSDDHGGGEPEASDDHGGNSGPGGGGDDSGGSDDGAGAHETDDHSGSDDGSGGGGSDDGSGGEGVDD